MKCGKMSLDEMISTLNVIGSEERCRQLRSGELILIPRGDQITKWKVRRLILDLSTPPKLPFEGAVIEANTSGPTIKIEKRRDGELYIGGKRCTLYLSEHQKNGQTIRGHELRQELNGKSVLNASVLDFLLEHPEMIPESWKRDEKDNTRYIFFWGTIYRSSGGRLCVRYLYCYVGTWSWYSRWLGREWDLQDPAVLAS